MPRVGALAVAVALLPACSAFTLGRAPPLRRASLLRLQEDAEAPAQAGFSEEETAALYEASISTKKSWTSEEPCPQALQNLFLGPEKFFPLLRSQKNDPAPEVWDAVRREWPLLAGKSDAELLEALGPIKAQYVDFRSLDQGSDWYSFKKLK